MAYTPKNWALGDSITETDLDHIENGIKDVTDLATSHTALLVPVGTMAMWAAANPPSGWLECNGQQVSTSTYAALYAIIGTTYGSGAGTFALPNLKGKVPVGLDSTDAAFDALGETGGAKTVTLDSTMIPSHLHTGPAHTHTGASHSHTGPSHTHTGPAHTHTTPDHTHTVSNHTHTTPAHTHTATVTNGTVASSTHAHGLAAGYARMSFDTGDNYLRADMVTGVAWSSDVRMASTSISATAGSGLTNSVALGGSTDANATTTVVSVANANNTTGLTTDSTGTHATPSGGAGTSGSSGTAATGSAGTGATSTEAGTTGSSGTENSGATGGGLAHANLQPYLTLKFIIKAA